MKVLWQKKFGKEDVSLVILDERNYAVGKYVVTPTEQKDGTMKDVESIQMVYLIAAAIIILLYLFAVCMIEGSEEMNVYIGKAEK